MNSIEFRRFLLKVCICYALAEQAWGIMWPGMFYGHLYKPQFVPNDQKAEPFLHNPHIQTKSLPGHTGSGTQDFPHGSQQYDTSPFTSNPGERNSGIKDETISSVQTDDSITTRDYHSDQQYDSLHVDDQDYREDESDPHQPLDLPPDVRQTPYRSPHSQLSIPQPMMLFPRHDQGQQLMTPHHRGSFPFNPRDPQFRVPYYIGGESYEPFSQPDQPMIQPMYHEPPAFEETPLYQERQLFQEPQMQQEPAIYQNPAMYQDTPLHQETPLAPEAPMHQDPQMHQKPPMHPGPPIYMYPESSAYHEPAIDQEKQTVDAHERPPMYQDHSTGEMLPHNKHLYGPLPVYYMEHPYVPRQHPEIAASATARQQSYATKQVHQANFYDHRNEYTPADRDGLNDHVSNVDSNGQQDQRSARFLQRGPVAQATDGKPSNFFENVNRDPKTTQHHPTGDLSATSQDRQIFPPPPANPQHYPYPTYPSQYNMYSPYYTPYGTYNRHYSSYPGPYNPYYSRYPSYGWPFYMYPAYENPQEKYPIYVMPEPPEVKLNPGNVKSIGKKFSKTQAVTPDLKYHGCEWKAVFKAVSGNGREVYNDYINGGKLNTVVAGAKNIASNFVYRDGTILDDWDQLVIEQVRIEVYDDGLRKAWFLFDGLGSTKDSWLSQERLIASEYSDVKTGSFNHYSISGDSTNKRRFLINREYNGCASDCGYLLVADSDRTGTPCAYEEYETKPSILYNTLNDRCGRYQTNGEYATADKLLIAAKICNEDLWTD